MEIFSYDIMIKIKCDQMFELEIPKFYQVKENY